jgi:metal-sulfur cluster biosynthetic enzyme
MQDKIMDELKQIIDPELGIAIVDLGLVRKVDIGEEGKVNVEMTLTSPGCPIGPQLVQAVKYHAGNVDGISQVDVKLVFSPPWNPDRDATPDGKFQLSMLM